ncbi:MAG: hypothetical protein RLY58_2030 [Pseudomonadota bacterium]
MRLLFISQLFDPEYSIKGLAFLQALRQQGVEVEVITTFPNYPTGRVFDGYRVKPWQVEHIDGIRVIRVYSYISHSKSKVARALSYASFMLTAWLATFFVKKIDVVYAYHPQLTVGLIAIFLKWIRGIPFVTDVQDLWPDALAATQLQQRGWLYKSVSRLCQLVYQQAAHIVVLSMGYRQALLERGIAADRVSVVYNWHADESTLERTTTDDLLPTGYRYRFVYAGNLGAAQSLRYVIDAFAPLQAQSVALVMVGAGVEQDDLKQHSKQIQADNVFFLGYMPSHQMSAVLACADVLVVHLRDEPLFKITIPSKVQASLNSAKPILMAVGGEANQIIEQAGAGAVAAPEQADSITQAALTLVQAREQWHDMGLRGKQYYQQQMARHIGVARLMTILKHLTPHA